MIRQHGIDKVCCYEIRVQSTMGLDEINAMSPLPLEVAGVNEFSMLLTVSTDQSGLVGVLRRLHGRGLVLLSVRRECSSAVS